MPPPNKKILKFSKSCSKWLQMAQNNSKWLEMAPNGYKSIQPLKNAKMCQKVPKKELKVPKNATKKINKKI